MSTAVGRGRDCRTRRRCDRTHGSTVDRRSGLSANNPTVRAALRFQFQGMNAMLVVKSRRFDSRRRRSKSRWPYRGRSGGSSMTMHAGVAAGRQHASAKAQVTYRTAGTAVRKSWRTSNTRPFSGAWTSTMPPADRNTGTPRKWDLTKAAALSLKMMSKTPGLEPRKLSARSGPFVDFTRTPLNDRQNSGSSPEMLQPPSRSTVTTEASGSPVTRRATCSNAPGSSAATTNAECTRLHQAGALPVPFLPLREAQGNPRPCRGCGPGHRREGTAGPRPLPGRLARRRPQAASPAEDLPIGWTVRRGGEP